jgi:DNA-binding transcriptional ArsR family regulator
VRDVLAAPSAERLDLIFHALSDSKRRGMIDRLSRGPATVRELAEPFAMGMPSAVKHLALLEKSGLVTSRKVGRVRTFSMPSDAFSAVESWVEARKAAWNRCFDQLDKLLGETANETRRQNP